MSKNPFVQVRVDEDLKQKSIEILEDIGMDLPTAIRMYLKRIVIERGIPFDLKMPIDNQFIPLSTAKITSVEYAEFVSQIPKGMLSRECDIMAFIKDNYCPENISGVFARLPINKSGEEVPWWRVVSTRGHLIKRTQLSVESQKKKLREEGHIIVCGDHDESYKVENYKFYLFKYFERIDESDPKE